jgi:hypothetical protein
MEHGIGISVERRNMDLQTGSWLYSCIPEDILRMSERGNWRRVLHKDGTVSVGHLVSRQFWRMVGDFGEQMAMVVVQGVCGSFHSPLQPKLNAGKVKKWPLFSPPPKSLQIYQIFIIVRMPFQDITTVRI